MAENDSGGPWGGGGNRGNNGGDNNGGGRGPGGGNRPEMPEIDEIVRKGQEQLRVLMGGKKGGSGGGAPNGIGGPGMSAGGIGMVLIAAFGLWLYASFYRVDTSQQSVELLFGKYHKTGTEGLNFAPWPFVTKDILSVTRENIEKIGIGQSIRADQGLMLTRDENIVDVDFQVIWNIKDAKAFLFNLKSPRETIIAVSESVMREIVARTDLTPILTTGKGKIADQLQSLIQETLDSYDAGITIVRVNFDRADPPKEVANSFRDVQAAEQSRDTLIKKADAYSNKVLAGARGKAAQLVSKAKGYRAQSVNQAEGEASRFNAVYSEYIKAPEVTRKRLYLETMERVLGGVKKVIIDQKAGGQGVVPYLPLDALNKPKGGSN
ncbi:MAG: FtsH protease activity modulator HflK [Rhodobacterales bacterium]